MNWVEKFYKYQAPLYDITRWLFLFQRQLPILKSGLSPGAFVIEIGCGTGHNFALLHRIIGPQSPIIGLDLSQEMLLQAQRKLQANAWTHIQLIRSSAEQFHPKKQVDFVLFSYSLSMIDQWQECLLNATTYLKPEGYLGVVDFLPHSQTIPLVGKVLTMWFEKACHVFVSRDLAQFLQHHFTTSFYHEFNWGFNFVFVGQNNYRDSQKE